ncbi:MAG: hypothetical protein V1723_00140 [Candidatus Uhrbacteria bacterium]
MDIRLIQQLLALAAKTGDRLIVVDPVTRQPFVLMGLPQYEALVDRPEKRPPSVVEPAVATTALDPIVQRANVELTAWREEEARRGIAAVVSTTAAPVVSASTDRGVGTNFAPESTHPTLSDDERFYVEPLE